MHWPFSLAKIRLFLHEHEKKHHPAAKWEKLILRITPSSSQLFTEKCLLYLNNNTESLRLRDRISLYFLVLGKSVL